MNLIDDPRWALAVMSQLFEPGDADVDDFLEEHGVRDALRFIEARRLPPRLLNIAGPNLPHFNAERAARELKVATEKCHSRVLIATDEEWPVQLKDLQFLHDESELHTRVPRALWVRGEGNLAELTKQSVAIVGSRNCSPYGEHVAGDIASDLAQRGWTIVSGGAIGIDHAAHDGALVVEGTTVVVFANGLDQMYPTSCSRLFNRVPERGMLVSEWPPHSRPHRHRFLIRNRVIAALSSATLVVEAERRSGARNTARFATELERPLMFIPGPVTSSRSEGIHQLAREPGEARLVTSAEDIIEDLGGELARPPAPERRERDGLNEISSRILDCFTPGYVTTPQKIAEEGKIPTSIVETTLMTLQRDGWVEKHSGRWRLARQLAHR